VESVIILVPVLNRPENVQPLIDSFRASETPGKILFIANIDDTDEWDALQDAGADVLAVGDDRVSWPQKINDGFEASKEPWVLCGADDIRFHKGWFQATAYLRERFSVIGTNDLGNARVLAGEHTTHPLIRREYGEILGTVDEPGKLVHEGYRHWFVDDELVTTAKRRRQWAFCKDAIVEHLHPYWGKGEWDEVYELGRSEAGQDKAHFIERMHLIEHA
jgi:glycosyltransferase involved in cell wall biosynthesis